ncbi:NAD(P)/FAD-dependent oxidoreductase [Candidatus Riesia pediculicola]|uniref:NADH dehydrogenase n=1 Tax=Riesia pediculicola (strain USDA) TaxID=515618 RepID=D4G7Z4_RIEPU|nr:NAD(P)/FAD-dependent oxidoreductase [Candidatus Riesia pediculicola]ADD79483.1 NADH dehydrogenase [Candidatus Riesia pediculicola USDA]ARC53706.1 NADH dehydrogenase [Candidatus Riesia pediculicola]QOJ86348.1 NAD(P)/FAD-dependent oxidoreductase [Candidatus Riesia pediculicola]
MTKKRVTIVIVGGGVGGLKLATKLGNNLGKSKLANIILVDQNHSYIWKPILHEVASGSINMHLNSVNYFNHAYKHHFHFHLGELRNIDKEKKMITVSTFFDGGKEKFLERKIKFDILVISLGSISNDFNIEGVKEHCTFLDNFEQANLFREKIIDIFFRKLMVKGNESKIKVAIVGGGATGVELCAELFNMLNYLNEYKFEGFNKYQLKVYLLEAEKRILPSLSERVSQIVKKELEKVGTLILTNTKVKKVFQYGLQTDSSKIYSDLIVWVAGVKVQNFIKDIDNIKTNSINQIIVRPTLQTTLNDQIFAIGDCAFLQEESGRIVPPRAQAASQMADLCYQNILLMLKKKTLRSYSYKDRGFLISLSKLNTVGNIFINPIKRPIQIHGSLARIIYLSLYRNYQISIHGFLKTFSSTIFENFDRLSKSSRFNLY